MSTIPVEYKQTEIGVIPEDWDVKELSELTTLMTNGFVGTVKSQYTDLDDGITYIQGYNVEENSFNFRGIKKVTVEFHKQHLKSCLQEGDLLTVQTGDVGLTTIVPKELVGANCHALIISRFKKEKSHPKYFSLYLNSLQGRARLKEIEIGTTMKHINVGDMLHFLVPCPTKTEQQAIATALSDADALIESLEKLIAKKRQIKQGAMQELLSPKEGWEVKKLGEIGDIVTGSTPPTQNKEYWNGSIPWITPTDISNFEKNIYNSEREISHAGLRVIRKLPANTLLVTCIASIGKNAILRSNGACNQQINAIIPYGHYDVDFLYYLIENNNKYLLGKAGITATLMISKKDFSEINFSFPTKAEQTAIATILSDMDAEITALEERLEKTRTLKSGMMHELLTGRIRLV